MAKSKKSNDIHRVERSEFNPRSNQQVRLKREVYLKKQEKEGLQTFGEALANEFIYKQLESRQFEDPFVDSYRDLQAIGQYLPIQPTYNPNLIRKIPQENNILNQCIEAMVQNIEGTGHTLEYIGPMEDDKTPDDQAGAEAERLRIEAFLSAPNEQYSFEELRRRFRRDKETFGYAFLEIVRDDAGIINTLYHIPAHSVRETAYDPELVDVSYKLIRGNRTEDIKRRKRFRRFVQEDALRAKFIYFKEFGDNRIINLETGRVDNATPVSLRATEILMISDYKPGSLYGYPRWINQLPSILGSRESEVVNMEFFKDNAIPALALLVSGGCLSTDAVDAISDKFTRGRGRGRMNEILIIEATGDAEAATPTGQIPVPRLEMKPMTGERQTDALFQEYGIQCQQNIRSAFRLPPLVLGLSNDYSHATAEASMTVCESQVFAPERQDFDELVNKQLIGDGTNAPRFWRFKSNPVKIVDKNDIAKNIDTLEKVGALTPNVAIGLANQLFGLKIPTIEYAWADYPYSLTIELIKKGQEIIDLEGLITAFKTLTETNPKTPAENQAAESINKMTNKLQLAGSV